MNTQKLASNPYSDQNVINELTDLACSDPDRLLLELGIDCTRQGKKFAGACPVHNGDNPGAFNFYPEGEEVRGLWTCRTHGCHKEHRRTLIGLVRAILSNTMGRQCPWKNAVDWLIKFNGLKSIREVQLPTAEQIQKRTQANVIRKLALTPNQTTEGYSREWVRSRLEIPAKYYLDRGYSPAILDKYDVGLYRRQNRVTVPIYDDDYRVCIGFSARSLFDKCSKCEHWHHPDDACPVSYEQKLECVKWKNSLNFESANYLYNYWFAKKYIVDAGVAILVEGPGDVWRLEESGIHISLGIFGVDLTEQQRVILDRSGALSLIILLDNDEAGIKGALRLKHSLGRTYRLFFPKIVNKDVGELHSDAVTSDIAPFIKKALQIGNKT